MPLYRTKIKSLTFFCARLNLTPTPRGEKRRSRTQATEPVPKKQRIDTPVPTPMQQEKASVSSSAAGCIQICDVDAAGRYVQIKNMSDSVSYCMYA